MERTRIGIIGCGFISGIYCKSGEVFEDVEVAAVADIDLDRARAKALEFGIRRALSVDELLAQEDISIVVNLTIPGVHAAVSRSILSAGKHVYSEKPLAVTREEMMQLVAHARERGLRIGCAPDTFLGAGLQTCRKLIDEGTIGEPVGVAGWTLSRGNEDWHPDPSFFYQPGAGPLFDMGPYYLTAMTSLLGPVLRVTGSARVTFPERTITSKPRFGQPIQVNTPTHITGVFDFANGAIGTLTASFDVAANTLPPIEIYGAEGTLLVPDPNMFGGPVRLKLRGEKEFREVPLSFPYEANSRGLGVADMAASIRGARPHRASCEMAAHVLDLMISVHEASLENRHITVATTMERPAPFPDCLHPGRVEIEENDE